MKSDRRSMDMRRAARPIATGQKDMLHIARWRSRAVAVVVVFFAATTISACGTARHSSDISNQTGTPTTSAIEFSSGTPAGMGFMCVKSGVSGGKFITWSAIGNKVHGTVQLLGYPSESFVGTRLGNVIHMDIPGTNTSIVGSIDGSTLVFSAPNHPQMESCKLKSMTDWNAFVATHPA